MKNVKTFFAVMLQPYKNWRHARRAAKLLKLSKEFGLSLVRIERRGKDSYIVAPNGQYLKIGSGGK